MLVLIRFSTAVEKRIGPILDLARRSERNCSPLEVRKLRLTSNRSCIGQREGKNGRKPNVYMTFDGFTPLFVDKQRGVDPYFIRTFRKSQTIAGEVLGPLRSNLPSATAFCDEEMTFGDTHRWIVKIALSPLLHLDRWPMTATVCSFVKLLSKRKALGAALPLRHMYSGHS